MPTSNTETVKIYATDCTSELNLKGSATATGTPTDVTLSPDLSDNTYTLYAKLVDVAGNSSACSTSVSYEVDTTAPTLASVTVLNNSPTQTRGYFLSYGTITGSYSHYCILENDTTVGNCAWTAGTVPGVFVTNDTDEAKVLSVWLKDSVGNVSARVDSNSVTFDRRSIDAGGHIACQLFQNGTVKCWGYNYYGQLGDGIGAQADVRAYVPQNVRNSANSGNLSNVTAISTSGTYGHTCAILSDKTAECWGNDQNNQLGNPAVGTYSSLPVKVKNTDNSGNLSNALMVSAGAFHTCALLSDQNVYCWGENSNGQLGNNSQVSSNLPVKVLGVGGTGYLSNIIYISAGYYHTCAVNSSLNVYCWGRNWEQQSLNVASAPKLTPVQVQNSTNTGALSNVKELALGNTHSCALKSDGSVQCWGTNSAYSLGDNSGAAGLPRNVIDTDGSSSLSSITKISSNYNTTCGLKSNGKVVCWGDNSLYQLGVNDNIAYAYSKTVRKNSNASDLNNIINLGTSVYHSCAILADESTYCWGAGNQGQLGNNNPNSNNYTAELVVTNVTSPSISSVSIDQSDTDMINEDLKTQYFIVSTTGTSPVSYCALTGDTNVANCVWTNITAWPFQYTINTAGGFGNKTVSIWIKDAAGNVSARQDKTVKLEPVIIGGYFAVISHMIQKPVLFQYADSVSPSDECSANSGDVGSVIGVYTSATTCLFVGFTKKAFIDSTITTSCAGYSMTDNQSFFDWTCAVESGLAVFTGKAKSGKHLSDIIDFTNTVQKSFTVTLTNGGSNWTTTSRTLWSNTVQVAPDSSASQQSLNLENTFYIVASSSNTYGYLISESAFGSALLIKPGERITWVGNTANCDGATVRTMICIIHITDFWIEGEFNGNTSDAIGVYVESDVARLRIENSYFRNLDQGINLNTPRIDATANIIKDTRITNTTDGILLSGKYNTINTVNIMNIVQNGITIAGVNSGDTIYNSIVNSVVAGTGEHGIKLSSQDHTTIVRTTIAHVENSAIYADRIGALVLHHVAMYNSNQYGLVIGTSNFNSENINIQSQIISSNAVMRDFNLSSPTAIYADKNIGFSTAENGYSGDNWGGKNAVNDASFYTSFYGQAGSDSTNPDSVSTLYTAISNWLSFDTFYRGWFEEEAVSASPTTNAVYCTNGQTCHIWDLSLKSTDGKILNTSGDLSSTNDAFSNGANCPSQVAGTQFVQTTGQLSYGAYLTNAVEIVEFGNGNMDGLCQDGEVCLYTPNIGAYQGHGALQTCNFQNGGGPFNNITTLYGYGSNGY